jgi:hypothetical protein
MVWVDHRRAANRGLNRTGGRRNENQMARVAAVRQAEQLRQQDLVESGQLAGAQLPGIVW